MRGGWGKRIHLRLKHLEVLAHVRKPKERGVGEQKSALSPQFRGSLRLRLRGSDKMFIFR